ncbi:MAG: hypothetical protein AB8H79_11740, partial [Myxococcota bacterium]
MNSNWRLLLLGLPAVALTPYADAAQTVRTGTFIQVDYGDSGGWNNSSSSRGFRGRDTTSAPWVDASWPGTPWQNIAFAYSIGSSNYSYLGRNNSSTYTRVSQSFTNVSGITTVTDVWRGVGVEVTKIERWDNSARSSLIRFEVENTGTSTVSNFRIVHGVDTDPDEGGATSSSRTFDTRDDALDLDGDSSNEYVRASGATSGWTLSYGACNPTVGTSVGGTDPWSTSPDPTLTDPNNSRGDGAIHWRERVASISGGSTQIFEGVVSHGRNATRAESAYDTWREVYCQNGDADGDGVLNVDEDLDGDGIYTNDDTDGDGTPDFKDEDDDGDGVDTADEDVDGDGDPTNDDTDGDGTPDYLDTDDDGDGLLTVDEDGDADGDPTNDDTDGDGTPDYLDDDDDGDGIPTADEDLNGNGDPRDDDSDSDGTPDYLDDDDDGDGVPTATEDVDGDGDPTNDDTDGDGTPDYLDSDDDGDGIDTVDEDIDGDGDASDDDTDGDGTPDYLDT